MTSQPNPSFEQTLRELVEALTERTSLQMMNMSISPELTGQLVKNAEDDAHAAILAAHNEAMAQAVRDALEGLEKIASKSGKQTVSLADIRFALAELEQPSEPKELTKEEEKVRYTDEAPNEVAIAPLSPVGDPSKQGWASNSVAVYGFGSDRNLYHWNWELGYWQSAFYNPNKPPDQRPA